MYLFIKPANKYHKEPSFFIILDKKKKRAQTFRLNPLCSVAA